MIYRPVEPRQLWDTWLFEWQGTHHLFFLETHEHLWDHVGHAISQDLVHWETRPSLQTQGEPGQWNHGPTLTGMVVRHGELFYMFVGAEQAGVQVVGVYTSPDLETWTVYQGNPVMRPAGPHYLAAAASPDFDNADWRDPCITYNEADQYYYALLCARAPKWSHENSGAVIGRVRSKDLLHWEHLPPLTAVGDRFYHTEVPDVFELDGRHYLAFATVSWGGIRLQTSTREEAIGTFYMTGKSADGPFTLPSDSLLIGSGRGALGAYVGRTIPHAGGRLLYHHINCRRPAWGTPKMIRSRPDGSLYLQYMPALAKLETGVVTEHVTLEKSAPATDLGEWRSDGNGGVIAVAKAMGSSRRLASALRDGHLQTTISAKSAQRAGLILRAHAADRAVAVSLDFEHQQIRAEFVKCYPLAGWAAYFGHVSMIGGTKLIDICRRCLMRDANYHLRCFLRDEHLEVYLDDQWIMSPVISDADAVGDAYLFIERGEARFSQIRVATIEALS